MRNEFLTQDDTEQAFAQLGVAPFYNTFVFRQEVIERAFAELAKEKRKKGEEGALFVGVTKEPGRDAHGNEHWSVVFETRNLTAAQVETAKQPIEQRFRD